MTTANITPVTYSDGAMLTAARILATCSDDVPVTNSILRKAGVNTVGDLRTFEMRDALRQKGVGAIKLFNAMLEAAAQNRVSVDTLAHPLGVIPATPQDALRQALHAGLVLLISGRDRRIVEPVIENGIVIDTFDSDRSLAYSGKEGGRITGHRVTECDWSRRFYRDAIAVDGLQVITLTVKGRQDSSERFGAISWQMPTPMPADNNQVVHVWGVDRDEAMSAVAAPAILGGKDRDSIMAFTSTPVLADEQKTMKDEMRDMGLHYTSWVGTPLVGTSLEQVLTKMEEKPVLRQKVLRGAKMWTHPDFKRGHITDLQAKQLVRANWLESDGADGLRATNRLRRAFVASLCQPSWHHGKESITGYSIEGAPVFQDGQQLALWFDHAGCIRIETILPVTMSERAAMRQDVADEAGVPVDQIRYDIGTSFRGMIVPHAHHDYMKAEIAACPATWRKAVGSMTVGEIIRAETLRASFTDLLERFGDPLPPAERTIGCIVQADSPSPTMPVDSDQIARECTAERGQPKDPVRRTRLIIDEIQGIVAAYRVALLRVSGEMVRVRRVDDVDHSAGLIVVQAERRETTPYGTNVRTIRTMIDVHVIDSVEME